MTEQEIPQQNIQEQEADNESAEINVPEKPLSESARDRINSKLVNAFRNIRASQKDASKSPEEVKASIEELDQLSQELTS